MTTTFPRSISPTIVQARVPDGRRIPATVYWIPAVAELLLGLCLVGAVATGPRVSDSGPEPPTERIPMLDLVSAPPERVCVAPQELS